MLLCAIKSINISPAQKTNINNETAEEGILRTFQKNIKTNVKLAKERLLDLADKSSLRV